MLVDFIKRLGFAVVALALLSFVAGGAGARPVATAHGAAQAEHSKSVEHAHDHADAAHVDPGTTKHVHHKTSGACLDACCGPVDCAVAARPVSIGAAAVSDAEAILVPATILGDLALAYLIERPPRA